MFKILLFIILLFPCVGSSFSERMIREKERIRREREEVIRDEGVTLTQEEVKEMIRNESRKKVYCKTLGEFETCVHDNLESLEACEPLSKTVEGFFNKIKLQPDILVNDSKISSEFNKCLKDIKNGKDDRVVFLKKRNCYMEYIQKKKELPVCK